MITFQINGPSTETLSIGSMKADANSLPYSPTGQHHRYVYCLKSWTFYPSCYLWQQQ